MSRPAPAATCVADNVILAMFVDAGAAALLPALAAGSVAVTPSILDPVERPPFRRPPIAEFAKGLYEAQQRQHDPLMAARAQRRTAFYAADAAGAWRPVSLSEDELRLAQELRTADTRAKARAVAPDYRARRVDPGEAECAAVAIARAWTLWSDDQAIVGLVRALYPDVRVERLCGLLVRAVAEGLIACPDARRLYNDVFKGELNLWSPLTIHCEADRAECR
jgi:hypothetical protein